MTTAVRSGRLGSLALAASGIGMALRPQEAATTLGLRTVSRRGVAETRIGLGGTFAGLGLWALARNDAEAHAAVGATWLGAAVVRLLSLRIDDPEPDWTFWSFLAGELTLGLAGLAAVRRGG
jgi:hypothetical protein